MVNFGSRFVYRLLISHELSVVAAYITGAITAYLLMKYKVFEQSSHNTRHEISYFILINVIALTQTWLISVYLARYLIESGYRIALAEGFAHLIGVMFPVITSFIGHKY